MMADGLYDFHGNTVEVEGGIAFDLDSNEELPIEILLFEGVLIEEY